MAGLLDLFGGDATQPGALYGGLLSPQQNAALSYRGLLAAAGALGQAAMPSRLPIPIGAALGQAAAAMGQAQDTSGENALKGMLVGLQGKNLESQIGIRNQIPGVLQQLMHGQGGAGASPLTGASPTGSGVSSPAPNANISAPGSNDYAGTGNDFLKNQRQRMADEITNTPGLQDQVLAMASLEDDKDPAGPIEALFNRAAFTGKSLSELLHNGFYGPINRGQLPGAIATLNNPDVPGVRSKMLGGLDAVIAGSNRLQGATDQGMAGDPNANTTSGLIMPKGGTPGAIYNDWGGGPGGVPGAAAWRLEQQAKVGGKPTQLAQANTGTVTDAVPQPPGAPIGGSIPTPGMAGVPQGLLNAARAAPTGAGPLPPQGMLAPQAPQVAQAPMAPPAPSGAPGMGIGLPPVPNMDPRALAAAGVMGRAGGMGDLFDPLEKYYYQSPGYLGQAAQAKALGEGAGQLVYAGPLQTAKSEAENRSKYNWAGPIATEEAFGKAPFTAMRPNSSFPQFDANRNVVGWTQAPAAPERITQFDPGTGMGYAGSFTPQSPFGRGIPNLGGNAPSTPPQPGASPFQGQMPTTLGKGVETSLEGRAKAEQESRQQTIDAGTAASKQQATLLSMKAAAPNFYTGPFSEHVNDARTILMMLPGGDKYADSVSNYNDFAKNAGFLTRQAVHDTSPRAAVQEFRLIGGALPNVDIPEKGGLIRVLNEYMGLNDYNIAKAQAQQIWENQNGGPGRVTGFETDWQAKVSPYAFIMMRMDPTDRQKLFAQVGGTKAGQAELQHLGQQMQYIQQSGLERFIQ